MTWICKIFKDIGFPLTQLTTLWCDNVLKMSLASNPVFHSITKYVEIDYHYIRLWTYSQQFSQRELYQQSVAACIHSYKVIVQVLF